MPKREFLMKSHTYKDQFIGGWWVSEKLDGMRAFWDGGISRNKPASEVPWANTLKDYKKRLAPIATGLWSMQGHVIHAPDWWLDYLPDYMMDGELWTGRKEWHKTLSIVKRFEPDDRWEQVSYKVFARPDPNVVFADGDLGWATLQGLKTEGRGMVLRDFYVTAKPEGSWSLVPQETIPYQYNIENMLNTVHKDAEGIVFVDPCMKWESRRSPHSLKHKKWLDDEARVVGFTYGEGKYLGMMGALIMEYKGVMFKLSGFTDEERELQNVQYAAAHVNEDAPLSDVCKFLRNSIITFKYRELSPEGKPKEARYWRNYEV